jgi:two-component system response regulator LytT
MKTLIIDDDKVSIKIIEKFIKNYPNIELINTFDNAIDGLKFLNSNPVDLVFLDIHMPNFLGFDLIQTLKNPPFVVLITGDKFSAVDAFEYDCVIDYLTKPITQERFEKSIQKINNYSNLTKTTTEIQVNDEITSEFYINIDKKLIKIDYDALNYIEAQGDYVNVVTEDKKYLVHTTLTKIAERLPSELFIKIHRSYIVNYKKIIDIEYSSVLIDKIVIPISKTYKKDLMNKLNLVR